MVMGERTWFSEKSFGFVMFSGKEGKGEGGEGGIKREFKAIPGIWLNLKFSQEETHEKVVAYSLQKRSAIFQKTENMKLMKLS